MVFEFDEGYWLPGNSKFVLKRKEAFKAGCFKGTKKIQVDLTQNYLKMRNMNNKLLVCHLKLKIYWVLKILKKKLTHNFS